MKKLVYFFRIFIFGLFFKMSFIFCMDSDSISKRITYLEKIGLHSLQIQKVVSGEINVMKGFSTPILRVKNLDLIKLGLKAEKFEELTGLKVERELCPCYVAYQRLGLTDEEIAECERIKEHVSAVLAKTKK